MRNFRQILLKGANSGLFGTFLYYDYYNFPLLKLFFNIYVTKGDSRIRLSLLNPGITY